MKRLVIKLIAIWEKFWKWLITTITVLMLLSSSTKAIAGVIEDRQRPSLKITCSAGPESSGIRSEGHCDYEPETTFLFQAGNVAFARYRVQ